MATQMEAQIRTLEPHVRDTGKLSDSEVFREVLRGIPEVITESVSVLPDTQRGEFIHPEKQEAVFTAEMPEKQGIAPPITFKRRAVNQERMSSYYMREGVVQCIKDTTFIARLYDPRHLEPDEEAEFYIEDLSRDDLPLLKLGAIFFWNIGYHDRPSGRLRYSLIKFRRLPVWKKEDLIDIKRKTKELLELFGDE